jgi:hypothetical protein
MLNAIGNNHIEFKHSNEKAQLVDQLKASLEVLNESPKIRLGIYSNKENELNKNIKGNETTNAIPNFQYDEVTFGRGRKHFHNHPGMQSNIDLTFQQNFTSPKEKIDQLINYYLDSSKKEKTYNYSPDLYTLYNKEKLDPTIKYSDKVRHVNVSKGNLECKL